MDRLMKSTLIKYTLIALFMVVATNGAFATTWPQEPYVPLPARVGTSDLIVVATIVSDTIVIDSRTERGIPLRHREMVFRTQAILKGDLSQASESLQRVDKPETEGGHAKVKYAYDVSWTDPMMGQTGLIIRSGRSYFSPGNRYFLLLNVVNKELALSNVVTSDYLPFNAASITQMRTAMEEFLRNGKRARELIGRLEALTEAEQQELVRFMGVNFGNPKEYGEKWRKWWDEQVKPRLDLSPTWRETLEKSKKELEGEKPAAAPGPAEAPPPDKPAK